MDIAQRIRTLEIIGLCISLLALIISLAIFCAFRSLRNNRTKIHKNLFIAMVLQVIVRLTLYLDQFRRGKQEAATNTSLSAIENTVSIAVKRFSSTFTLLYLLTHPSSHIYVRHPMYSWNTHAPPCSCGCSSRDSICTIWSPSLYSRAVSRLYSFHYWAGVCPW